jgi:hypothetical protein
MANTVIDHQPTAQPLTGEAVNTAANRLGLVLVAMAVVSFVASVGSFASGQIDAGVGAASMSLLAAGASLAYRSAELRRVRQVQRDGDKVHRGAAH